MFKKYQLRSYNYRLAILVILTTVFGIVVINSADSSFTFKQIFGLCLAVCAMIFMSFVDYTWICSYYWLIYIVNFVLLLSVILFGKSGGGAKRWISLPGFQLQPSELTKIFLILFTSKVISMYKQQLNNWKFLVVLALLVLLPIGLVVIQPDLSTSIVLVSIVISVVFCAGLSYRIIGYVLLFGVPIVAGLLLYISNPNQVLLKDYQRDRIMAFIHPEENDAGAYQQQYSVQAIGSGQLTGKGLNNDDPSSLKNANYIAEAQTDFIFAVIGEELGFVGACTAILLLAWIVAECIISAVRAKDFTGRLICCGVATYIAFQTFINIGVVTRLLPNTGLPLPFFSYGLTSLVSLYISIGIVLNVNLQRKVSKDDEIFFEDIVSLKNI